MINLMRVSHWQHVCDGSTNLSLVFGSKVLVQDDEPRHNPTTFLSPTTFSQFAYFLIKLHVSNFVKKLLHVSNFVKKLRRGVVHLFPWLGVLARRVLPIPATSAAPERLFSTAGNVMTKKTFTSHVWQHGEVSLSPRGVVAGAGVGGGQEDALGVIFF